MSVMPSTDYCGVAKDAPMVLPRTETGRSLSSSSQGHSEPRSQRSFSGSNSSTTMISPDDYEALPESIQKKYFSSTERLRIVQQSAANKRQKHTFSKGPWFSPPSSDVSTRPATSQGITLRRRASQRRPSDPKPTIPGFDAESISKEQARWFLTLPDKIRKQQFSRKEQISLAVHCKRALQDESPELAQDALRRCLKIGREAGAQQEPKRTSTDTVDTDILQTEDPLNLDTWDRESLETVGTEMEIFDMYSRPNFSAAKDRISIPPPPPVPDMPSALKQSRRKSLRQSLSLTPVPLPPPTLRPIPPVPPLPNLDNTRHFALSAKSSRPQTSGTASALSEPATEAKHYQQSDIRKQLRNYLDPEKFDEALEFGFALSNGEPIPSTSSTDDSFSTEPDSGPSLSTEDEESRRDSAETLSPRTPTTVSDHGATVKETSFDSGVDFQLPQNVQRTTTLKTRSPAGSVGNREMTIHMTLTRRDLRGNEEELFTMKRPQTSGADAAKSDPLALEPLPHFCDDATGSHGAFANRESSVPKGLRRVWKSFKRH